MNKVKSILSFFSAASVLLITAMPVNGQDQKKGFSPLTSSFERVGISFKISSEVKIEDRENAPPLYITIFTFVNKGEATIRFGFTDLDTALYASLALSTDNQDLSISLKPNETKTIFIKTLKPPKIIPTNELMLVWRKSLGDWEEYAFKSTDIIHAPAVSDLD